MIIKEYLHAVAQPGQGVNPLFGFLGVKVKKIEPDEAVLELSMRPELRQGAGVAPGGIMATLLDEAMAHVAMANLEDGQITATVEMNVRYLKTLREGVMLAKAKVIRKGGKLLTLEGVLQDGKGTDLALAGATFIVLDKR